MSAEIDQGGAAFPCTTGSDGGIFNTGMTLRDWFAGQCLNGYLASWTNNQSPDFFEPDHVAKTSYAYADAMIAARKGTRHE